MNCQHHRLQITTLLDGSLSSGEADLRTHLSSCTACHAFWQEQQELDAMLGDPSLELELPAGIWQSVAAQIAAPRPQPTPTFSDQFQAWISSWQMLFKPAYGLAALTLLLVLAGGLLYLPTQSDSDLLAQIDTFELQRAHAGNPFFSADREAENPFFQPGFDKRRGNPFAASGRRP